MTDYISRQKFIVTCVDVYCKNCDRRKNGKGKMVYEIGDVPCRACDIRCVLDDVEIYMMILLKVARIGSGSRSRDNWIDVAGYAACGGEIVENKCRKEVENGAD